MRRCLVSTISKIEYPFEYLNEFAENGEALEVRIESLPQARVRKGATVWERFADFFPFDYLPEYSLGEGNTPLLSSTELAKYAELDSMFLKNETLNPTWSFKDRGSLTSVFMAKEMGEKSLATISTGNMGASIAAYGARAGLQSIVFIPSYCPEDKIRSMVIHGATIFRIEAPDYGAMKQQILKMAKSLELRIVSGNGPIRVEGYKSCAFELYEQFGQNVPDFIAVPTSACGHIRGLFKGFCELLSAGLTHRLPRMIIVQAQKNSPLVTAFKQHKKNPVPFTDIHTVATAITTGNPSGGDEILHKAYKYHWLAEEVTEEEIVEAQETLGRAGFFVEPSSATSLPAIRTLVRAGQIQPNESVVMILTGSGLKDTEVFRGRGLNIVPSSVEKIHKDLDFFLKKISKFKERSK